VRIGDYEVCVSKENELGSGAYATVYMGKSRNGPVAFKVIEYDTRTDIDKHYLVFHFLTSLMNQSQEISIMQKISHPNLLRLLALQVQVMFCSY
jgi:serine/threonine protein kinase